MNNSGTMEKYNYSSDAPISDSSQDAFNRYPFAKRVAQIISSRKDINSLVIGIYGAWGEGKTSVFNFIESELRREENVVPIIFNPWRFSDENTMLLNFFAELVKAIDRNIETTGEKIGGAVQKYLQPIAQILGKGENVAAISNVLNSADINDIKTRVETILKEEQKRVVILIDDIDRLEKSEIHSVFRMVKLTADFKYTAYILAFDKEMVSAALQERYGSGNGESGKLFLDKIIQVPLQLPAIEGVDIRDFLYKAIDDALNSSELYLTEKEAQLFTLYFQGLEPLLKTPRQAMLYSNIIMFSLPILKGEANVVDLMLVEAIRVFIPELYELIRNNKKIFLSPLSKHSEMQEKESRRNLIEATLKLYDDTSVKDVKRTLLYLFPRLNGVFSNSHYGSEWEKQWEENQRVCADKYFQRYFSYSVPKRDFSDIKLNNILENMSNQSFEQSNAAIIELINKDNVGVLIAKLRNKIRKMNDEQILEGLALNIANLGEYYPHPLQLFDFTTPFVQSAMLISEILQKFEAHEDRLRITESILNNAMPLKLAAECFRWLPKENEEETELNVFNEEDVEHLGKIISDRIYTEIIENPEILFNDSKDLLFICSKYGMHNEMNNIINSALLNRPEYAINLLKCFLNPSWGAEGIQNSNFERNSYDNLALIVNIGNVVVALNQIFPQLQADEKYPRELDCAYDELITRQFLWIHRYIEVGDVKDN